MSESGRLWACSCGALNRSTDTACEACNKPSADGQPVEQRHFAHVLAAPNVPEMNRPAVIPTYPDAQPGDDELIREQMAKVNKLLGIEPKGERLGQSPAVDPEVRAKLARRSGPESIGDLLDRQAKGAPR